MREHRRVGKRTRTGPLLPPPLAAIAIDGSNVAASATIGALARIDLSLAWCRRWRPDLPIVVHVDSRTPGRWPEASHRELHQRCTRASDVRYLVGPPGAAIDASMLAAAVADNALVLSNDRFADHADARRGAVVLQFECAGDTFEPYAEATWFTPDGGAVRVALEALRDLRSTT